MGEGPDSGISCAYCGGSHPTAADVRDCWSGGSGPARPPDALAGPAALGRNLLLAGGGAPPAPWDGCEVVEIDAAGDRLAERLLKGAHDRERLVIRADHVPPRFPAQSVGADLWELGPSFRFEGDLVAHLSLVNSVELESGQSPRFRLAEDAIALGAVRGEGSSGDVVLPGGVPAWCDGGPIRDPASLGLDDAAVIHRVALEHGVLVAFGSETSAALRASELAPDQLRAVTHPGGAARVIAPAGSGKTRVLTERARHLLGTWNVPPGALCLVAYNVRAAEEMRTRTSDILGLEIRTLNSLALAIVNGTAPFSPRPFRCTTIDEMAVRDILGGLVSLPRRANTDPAAAWIEALSGVRLGLRSPADVEEEYGGDVDGLADIFAKYRTALGARRAVDFDEQIYRAVEILVSEPEARAAAHRACRLLLVDEFQDLTPAHVLLLRLVSGPDGAVFGVGDDDQTIYGYAGASPDWLIGFARLFPGAGEHALEVNYRCPPTVVVSADRLLRRNRRRVPKRIGPSPTRQPDGADLEVLSAGVSGLVPSDGTELVDLTVERVRGWLDEGGSPGEVAVLARVNAGLVAPQVALAEAGIPVRSVLSDAWLRRTPVAAGLAWLRIAVHPADIHPDDLRVALRRPPRGISPRVIDWATEQRSLSGLRGLAGRLTGRDGPKIAVVVDDIEGLGARATSGATAGELLTYVRDALGLDGAMASLEGARRRLDRSAQTDDLDALVALARLHPDVGSFEPWLRKRLRAPSAADGVLLATVHSVKGREWPYVVLHDATAGVMPHRLASDREEERRVFHVALTRGIRRVAIAAGEPPSPFVAELFRDPADDPVAVAPERVLRAKVDPARRAASKGPASASQGRADTMLRDWRRRIATDEKRPAYTILHDSTIEAIVEAMPPSATQLRTIKGIGPAKLDRYGDAILSIVSEASEPSE